MVLCDVFTVEPGGGGGQGCRDCWAFWGTVHGGGVVVLYAESQLITPHQLAGEGGFGEPPTPPFRSVGRRNHLEERLLDQAQAQASSPFWGFIRVAYPKA